MILPIKIHIRQKRKTLKTIHTKKKYKMNKFNYINTLKRKRNEQFSNNTNSIKNYANARSRSPVAWVLGKHAMHCDTLLIWSTA